MENNDTIKLLKECDAGAKMAVSSINEIEEKVCDAKLKQLLSNSKNDHETLEMEIHTLLAKHDSTEKEPNPVAKGMSWLKTNMKLTMNECDATVADLITDGCNMGVKTLHKYQNQYPNADHASQSVCQKLISIEEQLCKDLKDYL